MSHLAHKCPLKGTKNDTKEILKMKGYNTIEEAEAAADYQRENRFKVIINGEEYFAANVKIIKQLLTLHPSEYACIYTDGKLRLSGNTEYVLDRFDPPIVRAYSNDIMVEIKKESKPSPYVLTIKSDYEKEGAERKAQLRFQSLSEALIVWEAVADGLSLEKSKVYKQEPVSEYIEERFNSLKDAANGAWVVGGERGQLGRVEDAWVEWETDRGPGVYCRIEPC